MAFTMSQRKRKVPPKKWDSADMEIAFKRVTESNWTVSRACQVFGVPAKNLQQRVKEKVLSEAKQELDLSPLSREDEIALINYVSDVVRRGFTVSADNFRTEAYKFANRLKVKTDQNKRSGCRSQAAPRKWYEEFCKRHNFMIPQVQTSAVSREVLNDFYGKLLEIGDRTGVLQGKRSRVWDVGNVCMSVEKTETGIVPVVQKSAFQNRKKVLTHNHTVLVAVNAAGMTVPPLLVFKKGYLKALVKKAPPNATVRIAEHGHLNRNLFWEWFDNFVKLIADGKPHIVLMGRKTRITIDIYQLAKQNNIEILAMPENCTNLLQPLDVSVFHFLSEQWTLAVKQCYFEGSIKPDYCQLFTRAYCAAVTSINIVDGFRKTGICPFNVNAIPDSALINARKIPRRSKEKKAAKESAEVLQSDPSIQPQSTGDATTFSPVIDDSNQCTKAQPAVVEPTKGNDDLDDGGSSEAESAESLFDASNASGSDDDNDGDEDDDQIAVEGEGMAKAEQICDKIPMPALDSNKVMAQSDVDVQVLPNLLQSVPPTTPVAIVQTDGNFLCYVRPVDAASKNYLKNRTSAVPNESSKTESEVKSFLEMSNSAASLSTHFQSLELESAPSWSLLRSDEMTSEELTYLHREHSLRVKLLLYQLETACVERELIKQQHAAAMNAMSRQQEIVEQNKSTATCSKCGGAISEVPVVDAKATPDDETENVSLTVREDEESPIHSSLSLAES